MCRPGRKRLRRTLNSIDKVKSFVNDITKFDYDFDLVSGRYVIDAKSIMGIFSLDHGYEIDVMQQILQENGYKIVPFDERADVYIVNTCTVTNIADLVPSTYSI